VKSNEYSWRCPASKAPGFGRPDRILDEVAVAFVTTGAGADEHEVSEAALELCARQLADFKVPREVYVIDALPEALLGKIAKDRSANEALKRLNDQDDRA